MFLALQAPKQHGGLLVVPPRDQIATLLAANHRRLSALTTDILGTPLANLRQEARREVFAMAQSYHRAAGEAAPTACAEQWIVAGHQPELFHPGVWVKNFALMHWAKRLGATSLNLVIDNDVVKATKLRVPGAHRLEAVAFDRLPTGLPYEEANVQDETLFDSLPTRIREYARTWPFRPMLDAFWDALLPAKRRTANLGERFAAARRTIERAWGYAPLEVPLSHVCETRTFAQFGVFLCENVSALAEAYNAAVHEYRQRHELRSLNHPVPDLAREGDAFEAPLWVWFADKPRRQRLFIRRVGSDIELRAGGNVFARLTGSFEAKIDAWRQLANGGAKVRTRALMTTLWSRLFLGDLFVHGIGGAKYDEVTDNLMRRWLHIEPPGIAALSATLWLPLPRFSAASAEQARLARLQRDLWYNPQRHLDGAAGDLVQQKNAWIDQDPPTHVGRVERFHRLRALTEELRPAVAGQAHALAELAARAEHEALLHALHTWREYAFCLYPEDMLYEYYTANFPPA